MSLKFLKTTYLEMVIINTVSFSKVTLKVDGNVDLILGHNFSPSVVSWPVWKKIKFGKFVS